MLGSAIKYSYLNARTRTMHSKRLRPSDWHILEAAKDRDGFLHYLATTSYAPWVNRILEHKEQSEELFERIIFGALFDDYRKILRGLKNRASRELILSLFSRFEAENLKIVLRAIFTGRKKINVAHLLYPVGPLSRLPWEKLWQQKNIKEAVKVLEKTPFGPLLEHALPQFEAQGRLFPLEMALDIACFRRLVQALQGVGGRTDRKRAGEIIGSYIDALNICHIARLRFIYRLSPEEALNYSYPGGRDLNLRILHDLARAQDLASLVKALPVSFRMVLQDSPGGLLPMRLRLDEWLLGRFRKAFLGSPFHLGVEVAHLMEKEIEIRSLVSLYQIKVQGSSMQAGEVIPRLFLRGGEEIVQAG